MKAVKAWFRKMLDFRVARDFCPVCVFFL